MVSIQHIINKICYRLFILSFIQNTWDLYIIFPNEIKTFIIMNILVLNTGCNLFKCKARWRELFDLARELHNDMNQFKIIHCPGYGKEEKQRKKCHIVFMESKHSSNYTLYTYKCDDCKKIFCKDCIIFMNEEESAYPYCYQCKVNLKKYIFPNYRYS